MPVTLAQAKDDVLTALRTAPPGRLAVVDVVTVPDPHAALIEVHAHLRLNGVTASVGGASYTAESWRLTAAKVR